MKDESYRNAYQAFTCEKNILVAKPYHPPLFLTPYYWLKPILQLKERFLYLYKVPETMS